jgi:hypothetical protein
MPSYLDLIDAVNDLLKRYVRDLPMGQTSHPEIRLGNRKWTGFETHECHGSKSVDLLPARCTVGRSRNPMDNYRARRYRRRPV